MRKGLLKGRGCMDVGGLLGNEAIRARLDAAAAQDRFSHSYLICGPDGSGKHTLAKILAAAMQCTGAGRKPCGRCEGCRKVFEGVHPDVITVNDPAHKTIAVDVIRQMRADVFLRPNEGKRKIYLIEQDMAEPPQNALLKTIEEPPEYAVIMLLTENAETLLPTIRSRCVMMKLRNIKDQLVKKYLMEQLEVPDYKADVCVAFAQGNMGKAIMLANSEYFNEIKEEVVHLLRNIDEMTVPDLMEAVKRCMIYKMEISDYLDMIAIWYRDVLIYKATRSVDRVVFSDQMKYIRERAKKSSYEGIENILDSLEKAKARMKANVNFELTMELLLLTIKEN